MMAERIQSPDGIIDGMGYPRKGVPVAGVKIEECKPEEIDIE
jgi:hypothetical protein